MRLAVAAIASAIFASSGLAAATSTLPSAFARPAEATDRFPGTLAMPGGGRPFDSRRVAVLQTWKWEWSVFIFKQRVGKRLHVCSFVHSRLRDGQDRGLGGGCSPAGSFFGRGDVNAGATGRVLAGVTSDRVAKLHVVGSRGVVHDVPLSRDHGFVFNCRAYNGCACVVSHVRAFDERGRLLESQDWRSSARNCRQG
jgi:hypothetical protein